MDEINDALCGLNQKDVLTVCGDLNLHTRCWYPVGRESQLEIEIDTDLISSGLQQMVKVATYIDYTTGYSSLLDVVITNKDNLMSEPVILSPLTERSWHHPVVCTYKGYSKRQKLPLVTKKLYNFAAITDLEVTAMNNHLLVDTDWDYETKKLNADD